MTYKLKNFNEKDNKSYKPDLHMKPFEKSKVLHYIKDKQDNYTREFFYGNGHRKVEAIKSQDNRVENTFNKSIEDVKFKHSIEIKKNEELKVWHESLTRNYNGLSSNIPFDQILNLFNQLNSFSQFYQKSVRNVFLGHFINKTFETVKTETSCICTAINIINELMKIENPIMEIAKPLKVDFIFMLVTDLKTFVNSIQMARRLVEMSLYCLCNYYNYYSSSDQDKSIYIRTNAYLSRNFQNDLYALFLVSNSKKIKISSSILLAFIKPITNFSLCKILDYLESIIESDFKNSSKIQYYGIKKDLILMSISKLKE